MELPKKVKYAIRMLSWHTKLVVKYTNTIKKYISKNNLECEEVTNKLKKNEVNKNDNQYSIYDFLDRL